jgi:hypothetical protein
VGDGSVEGRGRAPRPGAELGDEAVDFRRIDLLPESNCARVFPAEVHDAFHCSANFFRTLIDAAPPTPHDDQGQDLTLALVA